MSFSRRFKPRRRGQASEFDNLAHSLSILVLNQRWFVDELRARGHRVVFAGHERKTPDVLLRRSPGYNIETLLDELPSGFKPDRIIYHDDSAPLMLAGFEKVTIPTLFYSIDSHHHIGWHAHFALAFDCVLVAQRNYLEKFQSTHSNAHWFPLWAPELVEPNYPKTIGVSFRGNLNPKLHPKRAKFFEKLKQLVALDLQVGRYADTYARSKIVINQAVKDDINFRTFEAIICGALLITPEVGTGLSELFCPGRDLITYRPGDVDEAAQKIRYFLAHDDERENIAQSGRAQVLRYHTAACRAEQLEALLLDLKCGPRPMKHLGMVFTLLTSGKTWGKLSPDFAARFYRLAGKQLLHSAANNELVGKMFQSAVILCKHHLESIGCNEESQQLIEQVRELCPGDSIVGLSHIESLLARGEHQRAFEVAASFSSVPAEVLKQAPSIMEQIRKEILPVTRSAQGEG